MHDHSVRNIHSEALENELTPSSTAPMDEEMPPAINEQSTASAQTASPSDAPTRGTSTPQTDTALVNPSAVRTKSTRSATAPGPKSLAGKKKSSRNAFKSGFYSKGLLPWEDAKAQDEQWQALVTQWRADDPARVGLLRSYEYAQIQQERMMVMERDKIAGAMQSIDIAFEFAKRAGLSIITYQNIPSWFFTIDDGGEKQRALLVAKIHGEALHLKGHFSDRLAAHIRDEYPNLYRHIVQNEQPGTSFLIALGQQFKQQTTTLNLAALINPLQARYSHHLT